MRAPGVYLGILVLGAFLLQLEQVVVLVQLLNVLDGLETVGDGHMKVKEDQVIILLLDLQLLLNKVERLESVSSTSHFELSARKHHLKDAELQWLVVGNQALHFFSVVLR